MISLDEHNLLGDVFALLDGAESDNATSTRISFLVPVGDTHATTDGNVEAFKLSMRADDSNEAEIISEDVHIVGRWDSDSDLELNEA